MKWPCEGAYRESGRVLAGAGRWRVRMTASKIDPPAEDSRGADLYRHHLPVRRRSVPDLGADCSRSMHRHPRAYHLRVLPAADFGRDELVGQGLASALRPRPSDDHGAPFSIRGARAATCGSRASRSSPDSAQRTASRSVVRGECAIVWVEIGCSQVADMRCGFVWRCAPGGDRQLSMDDHRGVSESRAADGAETADAGASAPATPVHRPHHPARACLRRRGRLRRSGQRRGEPAGRSQVRLPAGLGAGGGHRVRRCGAVPLGEAGPGDRCLAARVGRQQAEHPVAAGVLAAGRGGGHGHRPRGGDRRRGRALSAVRPSAVARRADRRAGVARAAGHPEPARSASVRAGHHGFAGDHRGRFPRRVVRRAAVGGGRRRRPGATLRRPGLGAARHGDAGRHRDAARGLPAFRAHP